MQRSQPTNPGPFVVLRPCVACAGTPPDVTARCAACRGTGCGEFYHGTRAALSVGDELAVGQRANFGDLSRATKYIYFAGTLDAAIWGAELALGDAPGRIYVVEPTGAIENDPNLTDKKYPGNPTKSYRSRESLRVVGEIVEWPGHAPEVLRLMKNHLARLAEQGVEPDDR